MSATSDTKKQLLEELSADNVTPLKIRNLCKNNADIITNNDIRIRLWTLLLLGSNYKLSEHVFHRSITYCDEYNVLQADIRRTRQEVDQFSSDLYCNVLTDLLNTFCFEHGVKYKQGMNEICAIFVYIIDIKESQSLVLAYDLFSAFMYR